MFASVILDDTLFAYIKALLLRVLHVVAIAASFVSTSTYGIQATIKKNMNNQWHAIISKTDIYHWPIKLILRAVTNTSKWISSSHVQGSLLYSPLTFIQRLSTFQDLTNPSQLSIFHHYSTTGSGTLTSSEELGNVRHQFSLVLFLSHPRYFRLPPCMGRAMTSGMLH